MAMPLLYRIAAASGSTHFSSPPFRAGHSNAIFRNAVLPHLILDRFHHGVHVALLAYDTSPNIKRGTTEGNTVTRTRVFDLNKKQVIPDNTVYRVQRQLLSDPTTRGLSFEGIPSHTHFGLAKNKWPAPLSRTGHLFFGLS